METYTIAKVAFMLNVTEVTVLRWITQGLLKAETFQKGMRKRYVIHRPDLDVFCSANGVHQINGKE